MRYQSDTCSVSPAPQLLRLLLAMATGLVAAPQAMAAETALAIPSALVTEVLDIDQAVRRQQAPAEPAAAITTTVYVDSPVPRMLLLEMTLQIDTDKPVRHRYGEAESIAMQGQAVHRLATLNLTPGTHRLYAEYVGRYPEDKPGTPRLRATLVQEFEQPAATPLSLEIGLHEASFIGRPTISLRQWVPAPNGFDQAELQAIDLMIASGQEVKAAEELLDLQRRNGAMPDGFVQRLNNSLAALQGGVATVPAAPATSSDATLMQYQAAATAGDIAALDRLGREKVLDERALALRDKANAALGFRMLESGQGKQADEVLRRVRSPGPYSEVALLGLGWAQLVSTSKTGADAATAAAPVKTALGSGTTSFAKSWAIASDKQAEDLRRALVPWTELIGRDPTEASVQEAMLAIPYAMDHLGAHQQAQVFTTRAVDKLENTRSHLSDALTHIANGGMYKFTVESELPEGNGWAWWLASLPEPRWWLSAPPGAPVNFYMERLLQDDDYRRSLQVNRRIYELNRILSRNATALADKPDAASQLARINALRPQLDALLMSQRRDLETIATRDVQELKRQTENYLVEAHFAMARLHDRPAKKQGLSQ